MKKAFTLVELLVVIGIIAVLSGIMLSTMSGGSDSANAAKCLSNMRSLAMGCQSYGMSSEYYPCAGSYTRYTGYSHGNQKDTVQQRGWIGWNTVAAQGQYCSPYSSNREEREFCLTNGVLWQSVEANRSVYVCPMHRKATDKKLKGKLKEGPCWSYAMNARFNWASKSEPFYAGRYGQKYADLKNADKILLFAELPFVSVGGGIQEADFSESATQANDPILQYRDNGGQGEEIIGFNHAKGKRGKVAHVCFADGHTEQLELPRSPDAGNLRDLTKWLCNPRDDNGKMIDVTFSNDQYQKLN